MTLSAQDLTALVDHGVHAYRNREYKTALEALQQVLDVEPRNWRAKLYLAMSYFYSGEVFTAYRHFTFLKENCTDAEVRGKAEAAISAMSTQVQTATNRMPEMTCTFNKNSLKLSNPAPASANDDDAEVEWVKSET